MMFAACCTSLPFSPFYFVRSPRPISVCTSHIFTRFCITSRVSPSPVILFHVFDVRSLFCAFSAAHLQSSLSPALDIQSIRFFLPPHMFLASSVTSVRDQLAVAPRNFLLHIRRWSTQLHYRQSSCDLHSQRDSVPSPRAINKPEGARNKREERR